MSTKRVSIGTKPTNKPAPPAAESPRRTLWGTPATAVPILEAGSGKATKRTLWTRTGA